MNLSTEAKSDLSKALERSGLRATRQRESVYSVILNQRDHPTADDIYARTKLDLPSISLATVYNCLETLTDCGLVKAVNYERESTRYCPNLIQHAHFRDKVTGKIYDIDLPQEFFKQLCSFLPKGYDAENFELYYHGQTDK